MLQTLLLLVLPGPCKACGKSPAPATQHKCLILFQLCMLRKLYGTISQDNGRANHGEHERGGGDSQLLRASGAGHGLRRYFRPASSESRGQEEGGAQKQVAERAEQGPECGEGQHLQERQAVLGQLAKLGESFRHKSLRYEDDLSQHRTGSAGLLPIMYRQSMEWKKLKDSTGVNGPSDCTFSTA